jgi:hypothetical protein
MNLQKRGTDAETTKWQDIKAKSEAETKAKLAADAKRNRC